MSTKGRRPKVDQEGQKPGGKIIRGSGRGGISRSSSSSVSYILPSRIREAFFASPDLQMTKLTVSNLDYGITDSDMYELFSRFGPVKSAKIQCDKSGKSTGCADILFERRPDAIEAIKHCNDVPLEGREMRIRLSNRLRKPSLTVNTIRSTGSQKRNKRKCHRRQKRALRTNDDELDAQLGECLKSQLVISENL